MIHIGFVHGQFPYGGGEKITSNIAPLLKEMGYAIYVFSSHIHHEQIDEEDKKNITFVDVQKTRLFSSPKVSLVDKVKELKIDILVFIGKSFSAKREKILKQTNCKCIFAHYGATFWQAENHLEDLQVKAKKNFINYLFYKGFKIPLFHIYKRIKVEKYRVIYNTYDAFTVLCEEYKKELTQALGLKDNHKLRAISTPIISAPYNYSLEKEPLIIYVGRMSYVDKRVDRLVSIWEEIYKKFPDWQFVLIGSGKELPNLRTMVKEKNLERIITQKWIALWPLGFEGWCEHRRTGYPKFFPVVGTVESAYAHLDVANRLPFSRTEYDVNSANVQAAIKLLGGPDDYTTKMWWQKKN